MRAAATRERLTQSPERQSVPLAQHQVEPGVVPPQPLPVAGGQQQPGDLGVDAAILIAHHEGVHGDGPRAPQPPHESEARQPSVIAAPTPAVSLAPQPRLRVPSAPALGSRATARPSGERHPDAAPTAGAPPTTVIPRGTRGRSAGRCGWSSGAEPAPGWPPLCWGASVVGRRCGCSTREVRWRNRAE